METWWLVTCPRLLRAGWGRWLTSELSLSLPGVVFACSLAGCERLRVVCLLWRVCHASILSLCLCFTPLLIVFQH